MTISVVIPAYNEEKDIGECIKSVLANAPENLEEIIVVNNASTDKTQEAALAFPEVRVLSEPQKGLTKARQRALLEAKGELLAFIDADNLVPKNWFKIINKEFAANPKLVCLSGPYVYYNTPAWQKWCVKWLYWRLLGRVVYFFTGYMATGGNMILSKQALLKIGGFDTSIAFYGEDTDIARRLYHVGKTKFNFDLVMLTSGRRFAGEGTVATGARYLANYASIMFTKKPVMKKYKDIR
jgi:glycosyltransferase involved in cell wall biosynthesis